MSKSLVFRLGLIAALCASAWPALSQNRPAGPIQVPTEEVLAQFARMTGFQLSPDGKHMIALESQGDVRTILVWKTDDLAAKPRVIGSKNMQIASVSFLKDDVLAVRLIQPFDARLDTLTKTFVDKLMVTDLDGKEWKEPLESTDIRRSELGRRLQALAVPSIMSRMPRDPDHVVVEGDGFGQERDLFRYNVRTGAASRIMRLGEDDLGVYVDAKGVARAKTTKGTDAKGLYVATSLRNPSTGNWEEHFRSYVKDRDVVDFVSLGTTPNTVVVRSNVGRETAALYEYDVTTRKKLGTLFEHRFFEASGVRNLSLDDPETTKTYDGFVYQGLFESDVHWEDPKFDAVIAGVAQSLGIKKAPVTLMDVVGGKRGEAQAYDGVDVTITSYRPGEVPTYLVRVSGLTYPTEHYLLRGQQLRLLAKERPDVDRRALGSARFTYYQARDGMNIPAYLTVPNPELCGPGPYAAVVHPHGGPWARDNMYYDGSGWVPLMVSRCQVVLQPQFRGSDGWGRSLWVAGDREWGQKMQDDKDDGAKWLVEQKLADPKRIAMFGFSYGGYSSMAAAVRPNGLYKCAIAGAGVSDIGKIWADFYTNPFFRTLQEPTVRGLSPVSEAEKIKIPIMVYHGDRDQIVPLIQSEMFVDRAKKSDQAVEYHVLKDYAHGPAWTRETMANQLKLISRYFKSGCGGGGL